jgi:limonene-1,2-epoxide hydrolase
MNISPELSNVSIGQPEEVVLSLGKALNDRDFKAARSFVHDEFEYVGPFGSRNGAEAHLKEIQRLGLAFDIKKISADGNDVCALCAITVPGMSRLSVATGGLFACGSFQIQNGKVSSLRVHLHRET